MKHSILITLMALLLGLGANSLRVVVFIPTPQMHCQKCENKIKGNMRFEKGVRKVETDLETQHVTITYDSRKASVKTLQEGMKKIGYDTQVVSDQPLKPEKKNQPQQ